MKRRLNNLIKNNAFLIGRYSHNPLKHIYVDTNESFSSCWPKLLPLIVTVVPTTPDVGKKE